MLGERLAAASGGLSAIALGLLLVIFVIPAYVPEPAMMAPNAPGPQALPLALGWGLIVLGLVESAGVLLSGERIRWKRPEGLGRLLLVAAIVLAALLLSPLIGMIPAGIAMMIAITCGASGQRLLPSVVTAVLFGGALYVVFVLIAGIPVPGGSLWG